MFELVTLTQEEWQNLANFFYQVWNDGILYDYNDELKSSELNIGIREVQTKKIVAAAVLNRIDENMVQLHYIVVAEKHRKQGLASWILAYIVSRYNNQIIRLHVRACNENAIRLYRKFDFNVVSHEPHLFTVNEYGQESGFVMEKSA